MAIRGSAASKNIGPLGIGPPLVSSRGNSCATAFVVGYQWVSGSVSGARGLMWVEK
jgi:hypothetical protein